MLRGLFVSNFRSDNYANTCAGDIFGTSRVLVVEQSVVHAQTLVIEIQHAAKAEDSDPGICRIAEPSGGSFQGLDLSVKPLTDRIGAGARRRQPKANPV